MVYVHVYPFTHSRTSHFKKCTYKYGICSYQWGLPEKFFETGCRTVPVLFDRDNNFAIEEIMTDDILRTVNDFSHFSRLFEKHIGKKPEKYSKDLV